MELNWPLIILVVFIALILVVYLIYQNFKDEEKFEKGINFRDEHETHHSTNEDENRR